MCAVDVDVVLIMDRSGSMGDGENPTQCDWYELELVGPSYQCVAHNEQGLDEQGCLAKPDPIQCASPVFTPATQSKIDSAKDAANSFLNNMGPNDQSGLVSFSDTAVLDQSLPVPGDHTTTQSAVNSLVTGGSTNIGDAINAGSEELDLNGRDQAVKAMILLTDGKANKPNGSGFGEDPADVQHALNMAIEAANSGRGYKIFTVGLGSNSDINETMLQQIASDTNAQYYHAENGDDLSDIYDDIAWEICQYGSISGCKYNDENNNAIIDPQEPTVNGWVVNLNNGSATTTQTVLDGCYTFAGLEDAEYTVSETVQPGWVQTYPPSGFYSVIISGHNNEINKDFANYELPVCGDGVVEGNEICEIDDNQECVDVDGYDGTQDCNQTCDAWSECLSEESCGDDIKNGPEQCDGQDGIEPGQICNLDCEIEDVPIGPYCGDGNIDAGEGEICDDGDDNGTYGFCNENCDGQTLAVCGNGGDPEGNEQCDDGNLIDGDGCSSLCLITTQCHDGVDNDDDGFTDYPNDPGCTSQEDDDETDMTPLEVNPGDVVINELMWMGSSRTTDEWIELKNTTNNSINLTNCYLTRYWNGDVTMIGPSFFNGQTIDSQGYFLISNYDKDHSSSKLDIAPNIVDSDVLLSNTSLQVKLICDSTTIDIAGNASTPLAGDKGTPKRSMQRKSPPGDGTLAENWCTASTQVNWDQGASDFGTPGAPNDCVVDEPTTGSLQICKYEDFDGDIETCWDKIPVADWVFSIGENGHLQYATTTDDGCVVINDFDPGWYIIDEVIPDNWSPIYPGQMTTAEVLAGETTIVNFYNYQYSSISGYKYQDLDGDINTQDWTGIFDWTINLYNSTTQEFLAPAQTNEYGYYEFTELAPGDYILSEEVKTDWEALTPTSTNITLLSGTATTTDFVNHYTGEQDKGGDDGDGNGGGGGGASSHLVIFNEQETTLRETTVTITWQTNKFSTSQVIYSAETEPHVLDENALPYYGYAHATPEPENPTLVTFHSVTLTGLTPGTTYYYRAVSHASPATFSYLELEFTTPTGESEPVGTGHRPVHEQEPEQPTPPTTGEAEEVETRHALSPGEVEGETTEPVEDVGTEQGSVIEPEPEEKICSLLCDWRAWLLIVLLLILTSGGYYIVLKDNSTKLNNNNQPR